MSVFRKKTDDLPADFSMIEDDDSEQKMESGFNFNRPKSVRYTIDQAAKLVHSLKDHNVSARVTAAIVKQTLESVDISFPDIIEDAKLKEAAIQHESARRDDLINNLISKVEFLQNEKRKFNKELEKTIYVREFLQQALDGTEGVPGQGAKTEFPRLSPEKVAKTMTTANSPAV